MSSARGTEQAPGLAFRPLMTTLNSVPGLLSGLAFDPCGVSGCTTQALGESLWWVQKE